MSTCGSEAPEWSGLKDGAKALDKSFDIRKSMGIFQLLPNYAGMSSYH